MRRRASGGKPVAVAGKEGQRVGKAGGIPRGRQHAPGTKGLFRTGAVMPDDIKRPVGGCGDHRKAPPHRFAEDKAEGLFERGKAEQVGFGEGPVERGTPSVKRDMVKAQPVDHLGKDGPKRAVPVNVEPHGHAALPQKPGRLQQ